VGGGGGGGGAGGVYQDTGALNAYQQDVTCGPQDVGNPACDGGGGQSIGDSTRIGPLKP
jgi:hypothetical protein